MGAMQRWPLFHTYLPPVLIPVPYLFPPPSNLCYFFFVYIYLHTQPLKTNSFKEEEQIYGRSRTVDAGLGTGGDPEEASERCRQEGRESCQRCSSQRRRDRNP